MMGLFSWVRKQKWLLPSIKQSIEHELDFNLTRVAPTIENERSVISTNVFSQLSELLVLGWGWTFFIVFLTFFVLNILFGALFLIGNNIGGLPEERGINGTAEFEDAFNLSIQVFSSIGFGGLHPISLWGHTLVAFESLVSVIFLSVTGGAIFFKMLHPEPGVTISDKCVIHEKGDKRVLEVRTVFRNHHYWLDTEAHLHGVQKYEDDSAQIHHKMFTLKLRRNYNAMAPMAGSYYHDITDDSPLKGMRQGDANGLLHLFFLLKGVENHTFQAVYAGRYFFFEQIYFVHKFRKFFRVNGEGLPPIVDASLVHDVYKCRGDENPHDMNRSFALGSDCISRGASLQTTNTLAPPVDVTIGMRESKL
eukprot:m.163404 g.163404  ORF g.163404 m.163404 type:complete len:364 (+) comp31290_c0_seq4:72-1163(+)